MHLAVANPQATNLREEQQGHRSSATRRGSSRPRGAAAGWRSPLRRAWFRCLVAAIRSMGLGEPRSLEATAKVGVNSSARTRRLNVLLDPIPRKPIVVLQRAY